MTSFEENDDEGHMDKEDVLGGDKSKQSPEDLNCVEGVEEAVPVDSPEANDTVASSVANTTSAEGNMQPLESTSLLLASTKNADMLRQSKFAMHSMSPDE